MLNEYCLVTVPLTVSIGDNFAHLRMILAKNTPSTTFSSQLDEQLKSVTLTQTSPILSASNSAQLESEHQHPSVVQLAAGQELIDFDDLDKLLTDTSTNSSGSSEHWPNYFEDDEDLFEFDFSASPSSSDCSQQWDGNTINNSEHHHHSADCNTQAPFGCSHQSQTPVCSTSMSNYSISTTNSVHCSTPFSSQNELDNIKQERQTPEMSGFIGQCSGAASCASENASCTSSTPSTPYSFMTTATPLPSFNEIYSPRKISFTDETFGMENADAKSDFFNFEEYFSESNSGTPSQQSPASWQQAEMFQIKQEPMEMFTETITSSTSGVLDTKPIIGNGTQVQFYELSSLNDPNHVTISGTFETPSQTLSNNQASTMNHRMMDSSSSSNNPTANNHNSVTIASMIDSCSELSSTFSGSPTSTTMMPQLVPVGFNPTSSDISEGLLSSCLPDRLKRSARARASHSQICAVCGDIAACQHYGVLTCEGCKGFFKRTVQKCSKYNCMGNRDCIIDKRRRNRCQFCRFQKCLAVGMVKEVVRTDSLKGRRGRLPSKAKLIANGIGGAHSTVPMSTITALVRAHVDTSCDKANLDFSFYNEEIAQHAQKDMNMQQLLDNQLIRMLNSSLEILHQFVNRIPEFYHLDSVDQNLLFEAASLELLALRMAYRLKPNSDIVILANNMVLHRSQFVQTFGEEWFHMIERLSEQLNTMQIDLSAFSCLAALTVVTVRPGLENPVQLEQLENKIVTALHDHTFYNAEAQSKHHYLSRILSILPELRSIGEHCLSVLQHKQMPHNNTNNNNNTAINNNNATNNHHHLQQQQQQNVQQHNSHQNAMLWSLPCDIP